jgi:hypothetical protein
VVEQDLILLIVSVGGILWDLFESLPQVGLPERLSWCSISRRRLGVKTTSKI